jgi:hypothetical protein
MGAGRAIQRVKGDRARIVHAAAQAGTLGASVAILALLVGCGATTTTTTTTTVTQTLSAASHGSAREKLLPAAREKLLPVAPPPRAAPTRFTASVKQRALQEAHVDATPTDLSTTPADTQAWLREQIGSWQYKVPPDHTWVTTAATPNGIDITSADTSHFGTAFVSNDVSSYTVSQVADLVFQYGFEDPGISHYQVTSTEGPFQGPAGTAEEILSWAGTRTDGTAVTGDVEVEASPAVWIVYELDGPSASWSADLPVMLGLKANCIFVPTQQPSTRLNRG